ncbi:MAG: DUF4157 domain-containing protein [Pseudomonadota bacterium]
MALPALSEARPARARPLPSLPRPRVPGHRPPAGSPSAGPVACACGGTCPRCRPRTPLPVSRPGEAREREADAVADRIVAGGTPGSLLPAPRPAMDRKAAARAAPGAAPLPAAASSGQPLDPATRAWLEPRYQRDLGHVRVHTDGAAQRSARQFSARAYTLGSHIVFGPGEYAPHAPGGRWLLAHELAHVVQQARAGAPRIDRVPTRGGVEDGRYSYSNNCGWIDWSHADPGLSLDIIARVRAASDALRAAAGGGAAASGELTTRSMTSRVPHLGTVLSSARVSVRLLRPLSDDEILAVALSLFKRISMAFETQQEWTDLVGESSFSQEDLPSNLIAFYMAALNYSRDDIGQFCDQVGVDEALVEYDLDHDFERNRHFTPMGATGAWPPDLDLIDDSQAPALYDLQTIAVSQGGSGYRFCPLYRIEGSLGETDLFIISVGGTRFTRADNVRVVPTYRFYAGTHGAYGHTTFVQVEPNGQGDFHAFRSRGLNWPMYVPANILVCLGSQGNPSP